MVPGAAPHWSSIGIELLLDNSQISTITKDHPSDHAECCRKMFALWLDENPQATWQNLLDALVSLSLNKLAYDVKKSKYAKY